MNMDYEFYRCHLERRMTGEGESALLAVTEVVQAICDAGFPRHGTSMRSHPSSPHCYYKYAKTPRDGMYKLRAVKKSDMTTLDILIDTRIYPCFVMIENNPDWQDVMDEVIATLQQMINDEAKKYNYHGEIIMYNAHKTQYLDEFVSAMAFMREMEPNSEDLKLKLFQELTRGNVKIGQLIMEVKGNNTYNEQPRTVEEEKVTLTTSKIGKALEAVQDIMWGQSANAVIFCALRDNHGYADNMSQYERDWKIMAGERRLSCQCPEGTLRAAFRDNPYLKLPVEKWCTNGAPDRAIMLIEKFEKSIL